MLVETPQILWNAAQGESRRRPNHSKSKAAARSSSTTTTTTTAMNAALYSLDLMPSGLPEPYNHILVTAGNAAQVNVWSLLLLPTTSTTSTSTTSTSTPTMFQRKPTRLAPSHSAPTGSGPVTTTNNNTTTTTTSTTASQGGTMGTSSSSSGGLSYRYSLGRSLSGVAVQSCKFAPNGLFLAVASDAGTMLHLYSVPWQKRGNGNGRHYWNLTASAADLQSQLVRGTAGEGLVDVSWSADSQRLVLANIDHSVTLVQRVETTGSSTTSTSTTTSTVHGGGEDWQVVLRIAEHHHYVQGVAYDPLGVYLASMSHDRTVRLYPRKATAKTLKKVLAAAVVNTTREDHDHDASASASSSPTTNNSTNTTTVSVVQPPHPRDIVQAWLSQSKFEVAKTRVLKYAPRPAVLEESMTSTTMTTTTDLMNGASGARQYWFADEATVESFFRRLAWTVDGQYLLCPTALYKTTPLHDTNNNNNNHHHNHHGSTQHAVLMFRRHEFEEPHRIVTGLTRPAVAIVPNPVLFALPPAQQSRRQPQQEDSNNDNNNKENEPRRPSYRSLFAVLTWDCVVIYDTVSTHPLAYVSGLHYANFTDGAWSANGHDLLVSSSDGYVSLIHFEPGELGTPLRASSSMSSVSSFRQTVPTATPVPLPPCDPGPVQLPTHRPAKKVKVVVGPETPDTQDGANPSPSQPQAEQEDHPMDQDSPSSPNVTTNPPEEEESGRKRLDPPPPEPQPLAAQAIQKKKKRIQPTLVVAAATPH